MKKSAIIFIVLSALFIFVIAPVSYAESAQPRYSHVSVLSTGIDLSGSTLWCFGEGSSMFSNTKTELYVMACRQPEDGGSWSTFTGWTSTSSDVIPAIIDKYITVEPGYNYKLYVYVHIKDASGTTLESASMYSRVVSYPSTNP